MPVLSRVNEPRDLRGLSKEELLELCQEIRAFTVDAVQKTARDPDVSAVALAAYRVAAEAIPRLALALERPGAEPLSPYEERMLDEAREVLRVRRILHEQIRPPGRSTT